MAGWLLLSAALALVAANSLAQVPGSEHATARADVAIPAASSEPVAAAAYSVLQAHCARCHQRGLIASERPQGGIADILALEDLVRRGRLVQPGKPEASVLFNVLYSGHAPLGVLASGPAGEPTAADVAAVRDWVRQLPSIPLPAACSSRRWLGPRHAPEQVARALAQATAATRNTLRFLSIAHVSDGCASDEELAGYREGVARLVNSLTWSRTPMALEAVDAERTVFKIDLKALGWSAEQWAGLTAAYPLSQLPQAQILAQAGHTAGAAPLLVNADWLAAMTDEPAIYRKLLGLPDTLAELQNRLQTVAANGTVSLERSVETGAAREVERHGGDGSALWVARDPGNGGDSAVKTLFQLPNGLPAVATFAVSVPRPDSAAAEPGEARRPAAAAAAHASACLACHVTGPRLAEAKAGRLSEIAASDRARIVTALAQVGVEANVRIAGREPVDALAAAYSGPVTLRQAAAELGLSAADLDLLLVRLSGAAGAAAQRLRRDAIARADALNVYAALYNDGGNTNSPAVEMRSQPMVLALWPYADTYSVGDTATIVVESNSNCYLTVIDVDTRGQATVLFPNEFERDNALVAGRRQKIPAPEAPYRFRLNDRGKETLVGICTATSRPIDTVRHDFERLRFTVLGDWQSFQLRAYEDVAKPPPPQRERRQVRRRGAPPPRTVIAAERRGFEPQARAAATLEVR
jgi:cytochrome c553